MTLLGRINTCTFLEMDFSKIISSILNISCVWLAVNRVYCNKQQCAGLVCSMTWRKSLLLLTALNPGGIQRRGGYVHPRARRAACEVPPRRARLGVVPGRDRSSRIGRRDGDSHISSQPDTKPTCPLNREIRAQELTLLRTEQTASHL